MHLPPLSWRTARSERPLARPIAAPMNTTASSPGSTPPRTALVTGAARRLGREIALGLARAGWDVVVHYGRSRDDALHTVRDIEAIGRRAVALQADLSDEAAVSDLIARATDALGPVRCLVNNASHFEQDQPASVGYGALQRHLAPNLAAPLVLTHRLHESLPDDARAVVVNLLDQKLDNLNPDFFSYTLAKSALLTATRLMAGSFAPRLRVVGVSPGITLISADQTAEGFEAAHRMTPMGRSSTPDDVVRAVLYLVEADAVTGVNLIVDGGQHLLPLPRDVMYLTGR